MVTPACLRNGLVTVVGLNSLDHNHCSTTAVDAFHDTDIIVSTKVNPGEDRPPVTTSLLGA